MIDIDSVLDDFLSKARPLADSIVLVGSSVDGNVTKNSDIDLIVIAKDSISAAQLRKISKQFEGIGDRPLLDTKVFTEQEFVKARNSKDNFFFWSCTRNGKILHGRDILNDVKFNPDIATSLMWDCIAEIENAYRDLEVRVQFTGCCFKILSSLTTLYFAEKLILKEKTPIIGKEEYLKSMLGNQYSVARDRYYWVARQMSDDQRQKLKVSKHADKRYGVKAYSNMTSSATEILEIVHSKVLKLVREIESI